MAASVFAALMAISGTATASIAGNPKQSLKADAQRTLAERSFTVLTDVGDHAAGRIVYQAPNRTESDRGQTIVIGRTVYEATTLTQSGEVTQWGRTSLSSGMNRLSGPMAAKAQLGYLMNPSSVTATQDGYDFQETVPLSELDPGGKGQVLMKGIVTVNGGLVRTISLMYFIGGVQPGPDFKYEYTSFNQSPGIVSPPASKTVKLRLCVDAKTHKAIPGFTCGPAS